MIQEVFRGGIRDLRCSRNSESWRVKPRGGLRASLCPAIPNAPDERQERSTVQAESRARPRPTLNSPPMRPKNFGTPPSTGSVPLRKEQFPPVRFHVGSERGRRTSRSMPRFSAVARPSARCVRGHYRSPWISLEVASGDRQKRLPPRHLRLSPPTQMRAAINVHTRRLIWLASVR